MADKAKETRREVTLTRNGKPAYITRAGGKATFVVQVTLTFTDVPNGSLMAAKVSSADAEGFAVGGAVTLDTPLAAFVPATRPAIVHKD